jgi:hypothetical protein
MGPEPLALPESRKEQRPEITLKAQECGWAWAASPGDGWIIPDAVLDHRRWSCLHLPRSWVRTAPQLAFLTAIQDRPPPQLSLRSGAVVILTSAARSGGEVRITEAERPRHVSPGRRGCWAGIAPDSRRWAVTALCSRYAGYAEYMCGGRESRTLLAIGKACRLAGFQSAYAALNNSSTTRRLERGGAGAWIVRLRRGVATTADWNAAISRTTSSPNSSSSRW